MKKTAQSGKNKDSNRRDFLKLAAVGTIGLAIHATTGGKNMSDKDSKEMLVYVGTYTSGKSKSEGIYIYKLNLDSGELKPYLTVRNVVDPSYLAIDKSKKYLYAVNELLEYEGKKSGAISAFAIDQKTGNLTFLNKQPTLGAAPCFVSVSENQKFVLVANYLGGNAAVFPIDADGKLGASIDLKQNTGSGPNKDRQEAAHAHSINLDEKNHYALLCDLGLDKIFIYEFDKNSGKLTPNQAQESFQAKPGSGPRHFAIHLDGKFAFVINELDSTLTALEYDTKQGTLKEIQTVSTLPTDVKVKNNTCADLHLSPNGKFIYGSNRGHDSIVSYKLDEKTGQIEYVEHVSTQGKTPRNFVIEPNGKFLLAANQNSDSIAVFRIDEKTGKLSPTGKPVMAPAPVCLKLISMFS